MRKLPLLLLLLVSATLLVACGAATAAPSGVVSLESIEPDPRASATPSASVDPEEAMLAFNRCMREQGIDLPDPGSGEPAVIRVGEDGLDPEQFQAANDACRHHLDGVIQEGGPDLTPEQEDALLAFASCMREHGVEMPDPKDGGFLVPADGGTGEGGAGFTDPNDPAFREAEEACRHHMADAFPGAGGGAVPAAPIGGGDQ